MESPAAFAAGAALGGVLGAGAAWLVLRRREALYARLASFALHEVNTPLTAVNMTVLNLLSGVFGELPAPFVPWVRMTRDQLGRLGGMIGEMRDLVHLDLHRDLRVAREEADAAGLAEPALALVRESLAQAKVELEVELPGGLPAAWTDADRATRCLASLLFHARKFRVAGPVRLEALAAGGRLSFAVSYQGPKLEPGEVEDCLDPFYPVRRRGGQVLAATGLGLGVVRRVAREIGGDLDFACDAAGRARATLTLGAKESSA